jgi:ribonuclease Y
MFLQYALPSLFIGLVIGYFLRRYIAKLKGASAKETAEDILKEAQKEAEAKKEKLFLKQKINFLKNEAILRGRREREGMSSRDGKNAFSRKKKTLTKELMS